MSTQSDAVRLASTCVCGHVREHHGSQPLQQMLYNPRCQWRGCGCPHWTTRPEVGRYELTLTEYEAANLMQLVDAIYRFPHDKERVPAETPVGRFNSGDWIGQLHWKLQAEVGDDYPVTPNAVWTGDV